MKLVVHYKKPEWKSFADSCTSIFLLLDKNILYQVLKQIGNSKSLR